MTSNLADAAMSTGHVNGDVVADFTEAVRHWPHRTAVDHNGATLTYGAIAERVGDASSHYQLHRTHTGANDLIGALVSHTPGVIDHLLGALTAGAAYCPIDATLPAARKNALAAVLGLDVLHAIAGDPRGETDLPIEVVGGDPQPRAWLRLDPFHHPVMRRTSCALRVRRELRNP